MLNDFLQKMAEGLKKDSGLISVPGMRNGVKVSQEEQDAIWDERVRQIEADRVAAEAEAKRLLASIVFVAQNGDRFIPLQKAGALRNGNELGKGGVFHAVAIDDGQTASHVWDQKQAICGTYPSIMWASTSEGDAISCPRCLKKLGRLKP
ncbi:hypothetical protein [Rhizobium sp. RU36D]|uniref:hypothetical protein n=1 Tax=Rhizobium sp. RU36D TaxID=1907415 RepID=UPI0009D7C682|nr:hypothetical protein [Rhizobium sp. RU36D]SMD16379.1 hypothetical protein SAMN05880593_12969 [Rhizobium sp. RU36D]